MSKLVYSRLPPLVKNSIIPAIIFLASVCVHAFDAGHAKVLTALAAGMLLMLHNRFSVESSAIELSRKMELASVFMVADLESENRLRTAFKNLAEERITRGKALMQVDSTLGNVFTILAATKEFFKNSLVKDGISLDVSIAYFERVDGEIRIKSIHSIQNEELTGRTQGTSHPTGFLAAVNKPSCGFLRAAQGGRFLVVSKKEELDKDEHESSYLLFPGEERNSAASLFVIPIRLGVSGLPVTCAVGIKAGDASSFDPRRRSDYESYANMIEAKISLALILHNFVSARYATTSRSRYHFKGVFRPTGPGGSIQLHLSIEYYSPSLPEKIYAVGAVSKTETLFEEYGSRRECMLRWRIDNWSEASKPQIDDVFHLSEMRLDGERIQMVQDKIKLGAGELVSRFSSSISREQRGGMLSCKAIAGRWDSASPQIAVPLHVFVDCDCPRWEIEVDSGCSDFLLRVDHSDLCAPMHKSIEERENKVAITIGDGIAESGSRIVVYLDKKK